MDDVDTLKTQSMVAVRIHKSHSAVIVKNDSRSWALAALLCGLLALACWADEPE